MLFYRVSDWKIALFFSKRKPFQLSFGTNCSVRLSFSEWFPENPSKTRSGVQTFACSATSAEVDFDPIDYRGSRYGGNRPTDRWHCSSEHNVSGFHSYDFYRFLIQFKRTLCTSFTFSNIGISAIFFEEVLKSVGRLWLVRQLYSVHVFDILLWCWCFVQDLRMLMFGVLGATFILLIFFCAGLFLKKPAAWKFFEFFTAFCNFFSQSQLCFFLLTESCQDFSSRFQCKAWHSVAPKLVIFIYNFWNCLQFKR